MTTKDDGGPAFPQYAGKPVSGGGIYYDVAGGMTLRDYAAIHADLSDTRVSADDATALMGREFPSDTVGRYIFGAELVARIRYIAADAMLAARKGGAE